jgi:hypothetical protein
LADQFLRCFVRKVSIRVKSLRRICDHHFRLIDRKHVYIHEDLPQVTLRPSCPERAMEAPMMAAGFPDQALSPYGRDAQSIAFFSTPETE